MDLAFFVSGAALFDSLATAQQIIILILLFSTNRPVASATSFLLGIGVSYWLCGVFGLPYVDAIYAWIQSVFPQLLANSSPDYYQSEILVGAAFAVGAPIWAWYRKKHPKPSMENKLVSRLKTMNIAVTAGLGVFFSVSSFPVAIPYLMSLKKIAATPLTWISAQSYVLLYNVVYLIPLIVPYILFLVLREAVIPKLHLHADRINRLATWLLVAGTGLVMVIDAGMFFLTGRPWFPQGLF